MIQIVLAVSLFLSGFLFSMYLSERKKNIERESAEKENKKKEREKVEKKESIDKDNHIDSVLSILDLMRNNKPRN